MPFLIIYSITFYTLLTSPSTISVLSAYPFNTTIPLVDVNRSMYKTSYTVPGKTSYSRETVRKLSSIRAGKIKEEKIASLSIRWTLEVMPHPSTVVRIPVEQVKTRQVL